MIWAISAAVAVFGAGRQLGFAGGV